MTTQDSVVLHRTFKAPTTLVWKMWTEPEHFKAWYGPKGAKIPVAEMDVRVGGKRLICMEMQTPRGEMKMWFTGEYREVTPTTRLAYTDSMSDPEGRALTAAEAGMPDGHPDVTEVIVELEANGEETNMTMTHLGVPAGSPGAGGWNMAFDKLEEALQAHT